MNWKLIGLLSLFGLAMSIATVFVIPPKIEPLFWLAIFLTCAALIAKLAPGKPFLHGLCVSLVNGVWMTAGHLLFFETYAAGHVDEMAASAAYGFLPPRGMMLVVGPVIAVISGTVLGLLSLGASKLLKPAAKTA